jgi:hemoglobin-like flavoprotein
MTPEQVKLVQQSLPQIEPIADDAASLFYACLFDLDPPLAELFHGDLREQGRKLMQMIGMAVKGLDRPDKLLPVLRELGARHAGYGVNERDYQTVGTALLWTLERGLGSTFTPEIKAAWSAVYQVLADTMKAGSRDVVIGVAA